MKCCAAIAGTRAQQSRRPCGFWGHRMPGAGFWRKAGPAAGYSFASWSGLKSGATGRSFCAGRKLFLSGGRRGWGTLPRKYIWAARSPSPPSDSARIQGNLRRSRAGLSGSWEAPGECARRRGSSLRPRTGLRRLRRPPKSARQRPSAPGRFGAGLCLRKSFIRGEITPGRRGRCEGC